MTPTLAPGWGLVSKHRRLLDGGVLGWALNPATLFLISAILLYSHLGVLGNFKKKADQ